MTEVKFYERIEDELLKFAVIISKTQNKYIFCKHKDRDTWEVPGGHRESQENIIDTAKRELYEETGALEFDMEPVCVYSVTAHDNLHQGDESFGMLFFANIKCFETELHSEIEKITIMDGLPERWTYPAGKFVQVPSSAFYLGKFRIYQVFFFLQLSGHSFFTRRIALKISREQELF